MGDQVEGSAPVSTPVGSRPDRAGLSPSVEEAASGAVSHHKSPQLELVLKHAEHLLNYAVEAGIELDADIAQRIIAAKRLGPAIWDGPDAGALMAAITKLAAKLQPVTAETLRACREDAPGAIRGYKRVVYALAAIIIPLSIYSFVCTAISNSITADLNTANNLVTTLHTQLEFDDNAPPGADCATRKPVGSAAVRRADARYLQPGAAAQLARSLQALGPLPLFVWRAAPGRQDRSRLPRRRRLTPRQNRRPRLPLRRSPIVLRRPRTTRWGPTPRCSCLPI